MALAAAGLLRSARPFFSTASVKAPPVAPLRPLPRPLPRPRPRGLPRPGAGASPSTASDSVSLESAFRAASMSSME
eukprot:1442945-Pyramimonas_sp.AAC.1